MDQLSIGVMLGGFAQLIWSNLGRDIAVGIVGNEAHAQLKSVIKQRFQASRRLPENHDIAKALRLAQLQATQYVVSRHGRSKDANPYVGFTNAVEAGVAEAIRNTDHLLWNDDLEAAIYASYDRAFTRDVNSRIGIGENATTAAWTELLSWADGMAVPTGLRVRFFGETSATSWWDAFTANLTEQLKLNDRFRTAFLAGRLVEIGDLVIDAETVWSAIEDSQQILRADMATALGQLTSIEDKVDAQSRQLRQLIEQLREGIGAHGITTVERAGLTPQQITAVLREFALEGIQQDEAYERLLSAAQELDSLRKQLRRVSSSDASGLLVAEAEIAIGEGRLTDARSLILEARELHRQSADRLLKDAKLHRLREAALLADTGDLDVATSHFLAAAETFDEAAHLAAPFDPSLALGYRYKQAEALRRQGNRSPEVDSYTAYLSVIRDRVIPLARDTGDQGSLAAAEVHLGNALLVLGDRFGGQQGRAMLLDAMAVFQRAIAILPEHTRAWAAAQVGLGSVLTSVSNMGEPAEARSALGQAISHYLVASEALRSIDDQAWAYAQSGLASALDKRAWLQDAARRIEDGEACIRHLEAAMSVITQARNPDEWAQLQSRCMHAYKTLASAQDFSDGQQSYQSAIQHGNAALSVFARDTHAVQHAATLDGLGSCVLAVGRSHSPEDGIEIIARAVSLHRASLTIMNMGGTPRFWATCQSNFGLAAGVFGLRCGAEGAPFLQESVDALEAASQYFTKALYPETYARNQHTLAVSRHALAGISEERSVLIKALHNASEALEASSAQGDTASTEALKVLRIQIEDAIASS